MSEIQRTSSALLCCDVFFFSSHSEVEVNERRGRNEADGGSRRVRNWTERDQDTCPRGCIGDIVNQFTTFFAAPPPPSSAGFRRCNSGAPKPDHHHKKNSNKKKTQLQTVPSPCETSWKAGSKKKLGSLRVEVHIVKSTKTERMMIRFKKKEPSGQLKRNQLKKKLIKSQSPRVPGNSVLNLWNSLKGTGVW